MSLDFASNGTVTRIYSSKTRQHESTGLKARLNLSAEIEWVVKEAEEMAKQTAVPASKAARTKNIRANYARSFWQIPGM